MADEDIHVNDRPKTKKKNWFMRHKILTGILVLILIAVIASASGDSSTKNNTPSPSSTSTNKPATSQPKVSKIGDTVRDGKFEFVIKSIKCGETSVGSQYANVKAQGQFCRLNMSVKNIGNDSQTLDYSSQFTYNSAGQKYSSNSSAAIYANTDNNASSTWYNDINPGNTVTGDIFYDVPKGVTPVKAELHDSSLSNGVSVSLQ